MKELYSGAHYFISGFELIAQPGLKRFVAIPLLINFILFAVIFLIFKHFIGEFNAWFANFLPAWLHWLSALLWLLFFSSFLLFFTFTFVAFSNILAAPFNSLLSEKVERYLTGQSLGEGSWFETIKDIPRVIGRQLTVIFYYLPRACLLLILFFIPIVQAVAALLWFLFNAWFMTLTYLDYPTDNHRISFRDTRMWLKQKRLCGLGFGMSVLITAMVPGLNVFVMPAAVAGATKWWVETKRKVG